MKFERMLFSSSVLVSFITAFLTTLILTFFPLIGTLGFEFSSISAVILSFLSVLLSASLMSSALRNDKALRNFSSVIGSILLINLLLLIIPFVIGLISSLIKSDCNINEGSLFYLLIPTVAVFLSANIGMLSGYFLGRKGIFIGLIIVIAILMHAAWKIYHGLPIFVYNPIFGLFPGPLYDEVIPISLALVISRIIVFFWGILLLLILRIVSGLRYSAFPVWDTFLLIIVASIIITAHLNESKIGTTYSREFITQNILSDSFETENFLIYFAPGTSQAKNMELIAQDHEWRYRQLKEYLDVNSSDKIRSYIYPDVQTRKKYAGAGETTIANPIHKEIHIIYDSFPHPVLKHELVHVMSADFGNDILKISPKIGLLEGIAVAADWRGQKFTPHQWAKVMNEMGMAPNIEDIVGFGFWYAPSQVSYTLMGSFSRYLIDTYGIQNFKDAYRTGSFSIYEKSVNELSEEWLKYLTTVEAPPETWALSEARFSEPSIFQATCPRRTAEIKKMGYEEFKNDNFYKAKEHFSNALTYNSNDPSLINWLAYSHYYDGNYQRAIEIANGENQGSQLDKNYLKNIKGNSIWQNGGSKESASIFESLRTEQIPDDLRRELDIKISVIEHGGESEENIKLFFSTKDEILQLSSLQEAIKADPFYSQSHYLLGRFFFNKGEYDKAIPHLAEAYILELPGEELSNENLRILGISQFASGRYNQAIATFEFLLINEDNESAKKYAQDFIKRSRWAKETELK